MALMLAPYASCRHYCWAAQCQLTATQCSLPVDCQPFPVGGGYPLDNFSIFHIYAVDIPNTLDLPGATMVKELTESTGRLQLFFWLITVEL